MWANTKKILFCFAVTMVCLQSGLQGQRRESGIPDGGREKTYSVPAQEYSGVSSSHIHRK